MTGLQEEGLMRSGDVVSIENLKMPEDTFFIRWQVTSLCNYACDFCIQGDRQKHLSDARGESEAIRGKICERLKSLLEGLADFKSADVGFIGGEVTVLRDFPSLVRELAESRFAGDLHFHITTNLSAGTAVLGEIAEAVRAASRPGRRRRLSLSASYYRQYCSISAFMDKLRFLSELAAEPAGKKPLFFRRDRRDRGWLALAAGYPILNDRDYTDCLDLVPEMESIGVRLCPILIRNYRTELSDSTREELIRAGARERGIRVTDLSGDQRFYRNIQALGADLEGDSMFRPAGYLCDAGVHNLSCDAFGRVTRCQALGNRMDLGNLLDGTYRRLEVPMPCSSDHCSCNPYRCIKKS